MSFSAQAWAATADLRRSIDTLPFLEGLRRGDLDRGAFEGYLAQDALYLAEYGRVLAATASQSTSPDDLIFWADAARQTVVVERELHASRVGDWADVEMGPTCRAYTGYLWSLVGGGCLPVLAAGVLPCFTIYDDVGRRLRAELGDLSGHAYGDWIATYGDPGFAATTAAAAAIVDRLAEESSPAVQERMHAAVLSSSRYEWLFWDAPLRGESWPG